MAACAGLIPMGICGGRGAAIPASTTSVLHQEQASLLHDRTSDASQEGLKDLATKL